MRIVIDMSEGKYFTREGLEKVARGAAVFASHLFLPGYSTLRLRRTAQEVDYQCEEIARKYGRPERKKLSDTTTNLLTAAFALNDAAGVGGVVLYAATGWAPVIPLAIGSRVLQGMAEWRLRALPGMLEDTYKNQGENSGGDEPTDEIIPANPQPTSETSRTQYKLAEA